MRQYPQFIFTLTAILILLSTPATLCRANADVVTMTLPAAMIKQSLQSVLPLSIAPEGKNLQGSLVLDSISTLEMRDNGGLIQATVMGSNLILKTKIGDQFLNMKIGELQLPLTCDFTIRFDPVQKILYVTPHFKPPAPTKNPQADAVLPFLALLDDKEYPVTLDSLRTFTTKVGSQNISVAMEPVDIRIAGQQIEVKMKPNLRKTH